MDYRQLGGAKKGTVAQGLDLSTFRVYVGKAHRTSPSGVLALLPAEGPRVPDVHGQALFAADGPFPGPRSRPPPLLLWPDAPGSSMPQFVLALRKLGDGLHAAFVRKKAASANSARGFAELFARGTPLKCMASGVDFLFPSFSRFGVVGLGTFRNDMVEPDCEVGAYKRFSSGYQPECVNPGGGRCKEGAAFDNNEDTYWRADCRELTGGCIPLTEYIGPRVVGMARCPRRHCRREGVPFFLSLRTRSAGHFGA